MIVLDTNVISALMRPEMNAPIIGWANSSDSKLLWTTAVSVMEVRVGLLQMDAGKRMDALVSRFELLLAGPFAGRVLAFDQHAAKYASNIQVKQRSKGKNVGSGDTQIAGITLAHGASLATRNIKDFEGLGVALIDPWAD